MRSESPEQLKGGSLFAEFLFAISRGTAEKDITTGG
jgi:hypothetical protein